MPIDLKKADLVKDAISETAKMLGTSGNDPQMQGWISLSDRVLGIVENVNNLLGKYTNLSQDERFKPKMNLLKTQQEETPTRKRSIVQEENVYQKDPTIISIESVAINYDNLSQAIDEMLPKVKNDEKFKEITISEFIQTLIPKTIGNMKLEAGLKFIASNKFMAKQMINPTFDRYKKEVLMLK